jgi:hypothetical protein
MPEMPSFLSPTSSSFEEYLQWQSSIKEGKGDLLTYMDLMFWQEIDFTIWQLSTMDRRIL